MFASELFESTVVGGPREIISQGLNIKGLRW
jgi:hypothetical protein